MVVGGWGGGRRGNFGLRVWGRGVGEFIPAAGGFRRQEGGVSLE